MKLHASFLLTALICTVLGGTHAQVHWDQECKEAIDCNRPLEMLSSDQRDIGSIASKHDIDRLCPDMKQRISCIDQHTKQCMARDRQSMFNVLYNGTILFINELCHNESYQTEFLKHAPCMNGVKGVVENCEANYKYALEDIQRSTDATQEEDHTLRMICCSFQEYLSCSDRTISNTCGAEARTFHKNMLDTMANSLIKEQCSRYPVNSEECRAITMASMTHGNSCVLRAPSLLVLSGLLLLQAILQGPRRT